MQKVRESVTATYETHSVQLPAGGVWTYEDYALLPDDGKRYEVIRGELYMSAAPRPLHQRVVTRLCYFLEGFLENSDIGIAFVAPIDVILPDRIGDPVQPDIVVIRRESLPIIDELNIQGAPDLVVEVLSPSNPAHDRKLKYDLYAEAGVQEYWIVDPHIRSVEIHVLQDGTYEHLGKWGEGETARSVVLKGFSVHVNEMIPT